MNRTERHEEHLIEAALDNAYDSNFETVDQLTFDFEEYPELRKLGKLTIEGVEDASH